MLVLCIAQSRRLTFVFHLYLKYYGGHVASSSLPDDMEFINMAIQASRPDGKPPVPVWVSTQANLVGLYVVNVIYCTSLIYVREPTKIRSLL